MKVVTANRLIDGEVVWQAEDGAWVERLDLARVLGTKEAVAEAMALAARSVADQVVVEPYEVEVRRDGERIVPERLREAIRAAGPTTHPEFGKEARLAPV
ncbi:DUF2849 domain-containing protein [Polymorphum gilvum]|uniref:DUF2849 domain-containing protein n=1 Tax=Polymorphum gilvum (strain LMG 25793 / CGMCC 1.9160 / SL003B-26A1) TaxID=991905 RepID=F2J109_POLGS|nr:DUF2849 domain-containing protein [Polymorphum gilvum]ADZ71955.1 hypothetical protein SL003B_3533 [Polymorphum gilvum SL003B-26A1]